MKALTGVFIAIILIGVIGVLNWYEKRDPAYVKSPTEKLESEGFPSSQTPWKTIKAITLCCHHTHSHWVGRDSHQTDKFARVETQSGEVIETFNEDLKFLTIIFAREGSRKEEWIDRVKRTAPHVILKYRSWTTHEYSNTKFDADIVEETLHPGGN